MRRISLVALVFCAAACARPVAPLPDVARPSATPAPPMQLPRDALPHDALTEWWYWTGQLHTNDGRQFGFEYTLFQVRRQGSPSGYLAHFAISDIDNQRFSHQARAGQGEPQVAFPLSVGGWTIDSAPSNGTDTLDASMQAGPGAEVPYTLHLLTRDQKPPALHHGGYIDFEPAGGSYYYSRTRLAASGTLAIGGDDPVEVSGQAWMDHQWGNFLVLTGSNGWGWDWYSLQLDDGTELMLYVLRGSNAATLNGTPVAASAVYGTQVLADGSAVETQPGAVDLEPTGSWTSPHTGGVYPSGWRMTLPDGRRVQIEPRLLDQELYFPGAGGSAYWEGSVRISGDVSGLGYVELTGYAAR